jgi:metabolite-proton symporter
MTSGPVAELSQSDHVGGTTKSPLRRVALSGFVGSTIEFYDFYIYGTAAALVFPAVFFPHLSQAMGTVASLATFAAAFLSRPLGAAFFGHFGDRLGRKRSLLATLLIMGLATVAVGLVPPTSAIGIAAPLTLLVLRLLQGFALGGEWAGSALLTAEYAPPQKRGMYSMTTALGGGAGLILTNAVFLIANATVGEKSDAFLTWGWRIPFLFSAALVLVAFYVRCSIAETPVFVAAKKHAGVSTAPVAGVFRHQRRNVMLAAGLVVGIFAFRYMAGTYLMGYASNHLGFSRDVVLLVGVAGGLCVMAISALSARLSDRIGRRKVMLLGYAVALPWSFVLFPLIDTGHALLLLAGIVGTYVILGFTDGPSAAFMPEVFPTRYRYTAAGLAFNFGSIMGGALPPTVSGVLQSVWGSWAIGAMLAALIVVSILSAALLPETRGSDLT